MRASLLAVALSVSVASAAYNLSVAVAPAIVAGDVDPSLAPWTGRAVAEMLSWEVSMAQNIRVVDPVTLEKALPGWDLHTEMGTSELEEVRSAAQKVAVEAVVVPFFQRDGSQTTLSMAFVVRRNQQDRVVRLAVSGPPDRLFGLLRTQLLDAVDSLGIAMPKSIRAIAQSRPDTKWDALLEYGRALRSIAEGNKEDGLRHFRETLRLDPNIASALVRTRTLEKELGR